MLEMTSTMTVTTYGRILYSCVGINGMTRRRYRIIRAPKSTEPQMAPSGRHMQKMTSATASQPTPDRPSWFHTQPAMVMM